MTAFRVPAARLRAAVAPVLPEGAADDDAALAARFAAGAWTVLPEPGDAAAGGMRAALGDEGALALLVDGASPAAWLAALDDPELAALLPAALQRWTPRLSAERMLSAFAQAAAFGQRLVVPGDAQWPAQLDDLGPHAPAALWVRGDPAALALAGRSAALVGSRASSGYGELVAAQLAGGLVDRGLAVVSGGAYGIDGTAHRAALASGGTTIAVLAGGLDRLYPAGNEALLQRVVETACAVAEAPCGTPPTRWRFLAHNRSTMRFMTSRRAALYLRISDAKNSAQKISTQAAQTRAFAKQHGYLVDDSLIFTDEAISGLGHKHRAQFERLLDAVVAGRVDVIVATEEERFARNVEDKTLLAAACSDAGAVWHTIRDGEVDPSTDSGEFFAVMRAAVGRMESRRKAARQRASNDSKREAGKPTPGRRVYGYEGDGMTPRAEEADIVKGIFEAFLAGDSIRAIVKGLEGDGIEATTGIGWSTRRVRDMLGNPRYGGALPHKGEILPSTYVEPIVTAEQAAEARALLADESRRVTPGPGVRHLMSGIASCGVCDQSLLFMRDYRCRADAKHPSIKKSLLDARVQNEVVSALLWGGGSLGQVDPSMASTAALLARLSVLEAEQAQIIAERAEGLLAPPVARERLVAIKREHDDASAALDEAREKSAIARLLLDLALRVVPGERISIDNAVEVKREIRARWQNLDLDAQRALVRALVDVKVYPGRRPERVAVTHRVAVHLNEAEEPDED